MVNYLWLTTLPQSEGHASTSFDSTRQSRSHWCQKSFGLFYQQPAGLPQWHSDRQSPHHRSADTEAKRPWKKSHHNNTTDVLPKPTHRAAKISNLTRSDFKYPLDFGKSVGLRRIQIRIRNASHHWLCQNIFHNKNGNGTNCVSNTDLEANVFWSRVPQESRRISLYPSVWTLMETDQEEELLRSGWKIWKSRKRLFRSGDDPYHTTKLTENRGYWRHIVYIWAASTHWLRSCFLGMQHMIRHCRPTMSVIILMSFCRRQCRAVC